MGHINVGSIASGSPFCEKREKGRTHSYFRALSKNEPALYFLVRLAHAPASNDSKLPVAPWEPFNACFASHFMTRVPL